MRPAPPPLPWKRSPLRAELLALYARADALFDGWACACSGPSRAEPAIPTCCHFAVTGREPYPTAIELEEVRHAIAAAPPPGLSRARRPIRGPAQPRRQLPLAEGDAGRGACPLLRDDGRCRIYAARPFGCRTFFCDGAEGPGRSKLPRDEALAIGRHIADLSARFDPKNPGARPLVRALQALARRPG